MARSIPNECCSTKFPPSFFHFLLWLGSSQSRAWDKVKDSENNNRNTSQKAWVSGREKWEKDRRKANMRVCYSYHSRLGLSASGTSKRQRERLPECSSAWLEAAVTGWGLGAGTNSPRLVGGTCLLAKLTPVVWKDPEMERGKGLPGGYGGALSGRVGASIELRNASSWNQRWAAEMWWTPWWRTPATQSCSKSVVNSQFIWEYSIQFTLYSSLFP